MKPKTLWNEQIKPSKSAINVYKLIKIQEFLKFDKNFENDLILSDQDKVIKIKNVRSYTKYEDQSFNENKFICS